MSVKLSVIVEGHTEKDFIKKVLKPYLKNCKVREVNIRGKVTVDRLVRHIRPEIAGGADHVTTLVDYYGFGQEPLKPVENLEQEIRSHSGYAEKVIPYVQMYEFEALLFSDREKLAVCLGLKINQKNRLAVATAPEDINGRRPPARLLKEIHSGYKKLQHASDIAIQIGIPAMMKACPRFAAWIRALEAL